MATLPRSLKARKVADDLGIPVSEVIGRLVMMWIYCVEFSPSGLLTLDDLRNSFCADSDLTPEVAAKVLSECALPIREGFLTLIDDENGLSGCPVYAVHDWQDYSGAYNPAFSSKKKDDSEKIKEKKATAAQNAAVDNALRAATRKKEREAVSSERPLLWGKGQNFKSLGPLFAAMAQDSGDDR